jgi:hypothetical protein
MDTTFSRTWDNAISYEMAPAKEIVKIWASKIEPYHTLFLDYEITQLSLRGASTERDLRVGVALPYSWAPLPQIGCFLNEGAQKWQCGAEFLKSDNRPIGPYSVATVIAKALGLASELLDERLQSFAGGKRGVHVEGMRKALGAF